MKAVCVEEVSESLKHGIQALLHSQLNTSGVIIPIKMPTYHFIISFQMTASVLYKENTMINKNMGLIGEQILDACPLCLFVTLTQRLTVQHIGAPTPAERVESHYFQLHQ